MMTLVKIKNQYQKREQVEDDYLCGDCRMGLDDYAQDMTREQEKRQAQLALLDKREHHVNCCECGIFVSKTYWVKKEEGRDNTAMCHEHLVDYHEMKNTY